MSKIIFKGANGKIDGYYHHNLDPNSQIALILHGTKDEEDENQGVTSVLYNNFVKNNFSVLLMNFKSKTKKEEDEINEMNLFDATIALNWLYEKNQETKGCWIIGYNASCITALQLVMRRPEIENYLLVSPSFKKNQLNFIVPCISFGCIIKSEKDILLNENDLIDIQEKLITKTESKIETEIINCNERNFSDDIDSFDKNINNFIHKRMIEFLNNSRTKMDKKRRRRKKKIVDINEGKISYTNPIKSLDFDNL